MREDFFDLLRACHAHGLTAAVQTNGRAFHSPGFCAQLADCGRPYFVVALHGPDAQTHDAVSRRPGSFEQTCQGIRNLSQAGFSVTGKLVMSRRNAHLLEQTRQLMQSLGMEGACFAFPHGHGHARVHYREIAPRFDEIRAEVDRLTASAAASGFRLSLEAFPLCTLSEPQYVAEFRYLLPGNRRCIPSHMAEFDWDELRPLDKRKFPDCARCSCDPYCEGPWKEYPDTFGAGEFRPLPESAMADLLARILDMEGAE